MLVLSLPLGPVKRKLGINFHCCADDTQHYQSLKPDEIVQLPKIEAYLQDVNAWMTNNFLLLNSDQTEVILEILLDSHIKQISKTSFFSIDAILPKYSKSYLFKMQKNKSMLLLHRG